MASSPKRKQKFSGNRFGLPRARLDALVAQATIDAYGDSEQRCGFFTMLEEHLDLPFETEVLGKTVIVERLDINEADEIVAVCRSGSRRQRVSILDLPLPNPAPRGAEWIAAYRHWLGIGS
ncbi:MAG TPA: calcium-binding protein [Planctomycetota bacterium]|nr:calcium-binding protein [Planctomycetota bacterium]